MRARRTTARGGAAVFLCAFCCILLAASSPACGGETRASAPAVTVAAAPVSAEAKPATIPSAAPVVTTAATAAAPAPTDDAITRHVMQPTLRLGHYSTGNGLIGLVLDRQAARPLMRMDGSTEVIPLAAVPLNERITFLQDPLGRSILQIDCCGGVEYLQGPTGASMTMARDADAQPLAAPPPSPIADASMVPGWNAKLRADCGTDLSYDVDFASMKKDEQALRNAYWTVARIEQAIAFTCRDGIGKDAVKKKLRTIRVANVDVASKARLEPSGAVLIVESPFASASGTPITIDRVQGVLKKWL